MFDPQVNFWGHLMPLSLRYPQPCDHTVCLRRLFNQKYFQFAQCATGNTLCHVPFDLLSRIPDAPVLRG